ncbi:MAG: HIT domain-containing protein [Acidobacteriota bacterium]
MTRARVAVLVLAALLVGVIVGGYLFSDTRPRSFLALRSCGGTCFQANELFGLAASVGVQKFGTLGPSIMKETDKTLVIEHPNPQAPVHYIIIPKKDLKNFADVSDADGAYLLDAFKVAGEIIREKNLTNYRITTNGPGYQSATYLHFHLTAN